MYSAANVPFPAFSFFHRHDFFHAIRHVYRSVWPAPRFGAALVRSAHVCDTRLWNKNMPDGWKVLHATRCIRNPALDSIVTTRPIYKITNSK